MTHSLGSFFFPGQSEELCLPALVSALALLPYCIEVVIQQHLERSHIQSQDAVVKGEAEAALLGPITEEQLHLGCVTLFSHKPAECHVILNTYTRRYGVYMSGWDWRSPRPPMYDLHYRHHGTLQSSLDCQPCPGPTHTLPGQSCNL